MSGWFFWGKPAETEGCYPAYLFVPNSKTKLSGQCAAVGSLTCTRLYHTRHGHFRSHSNSTVSPQPVRMVGVGVAGGGWVSRGRGWLLPDLAGIVSLCQRFALHKYLIIIVIILLP